jgi:hypothetical protein
MSFEKSLECLMQHLLFRGTYSLWQQPIKCHETTRIELTFMKGRAVANQLIISPVSHRSGPSSIRSQVMWDLWWTKWYCCIFPPRPSISPDMYHSLKCSILIYHPSLVQKANWWPTHQVHLVLTYLRKNKYYEDRNIAQAVTDRF